MSVYLMSELRLLESPTALPVRSPSETKRSQACEVRVYNFTDEGHPAHYYKAGDGTSLARRQYGGAMGIVLVVSFVAGTPLAYFVSHMYQRVALLNLACGGS